MDRRNQLDHQNIDRLDCRVDDNGRLERMPLLRKF
jgi:hypothetical protein